MMVVGGVGGVDGGTGGSLYDCSVKSFGWGRLGHEGDLTRLAQCGDMLPRIHKARQIAAWACRAEAVESSRRPCFGAGLTRAPTTRNDARACEINKPAGAGIRKHAVYTAVLCAQGRYRSVEAV